MMNNLESIITLPPSSEVLLKQTGEAAVEYSFKKLELEYKTFMNDDFASQIKGMFSNGKSEIYEHVMVFKKIVWPKTDIVRHINVNVPRKIMQAIVLFFKEDSTENEVFPFPNMSKIKISIQGKLKQGSKTSTI